jgi:hypothetical protein
LKAESIDGLNVNDLKDKIMTYGTIDQQKESMEDLGPIREHRENKKWRYVVEELKRSHLIIIRNRKPLVLAYDKNKGVIDSYA